MTIKSQNSVVPFDFDGVNIRTFIRDDQPWFVAADICQALGLTNSTSAIASLDDDERSKLNLGRQGTTNIISESGLYSLVLGSRKPEAKRFKKWVTSEVLPAIRRNGQYQAAWYNKRHAIASTSKVLAGMLQEVRNAMGKATKDHHYMNEHKLISSLLTGEYKGMDREGMTLYQMDFLAHFEIRNTILIGLGMAYAGRKAALIAEAKQWKLDNTPGPEPYLGTAMLPI